MEFYEYCKLHSLISNPKVVIWLFERAPKKDIDKLEELYLKLLFNRFLGRFVENVLSLLSKFVFEVGIQMSLVQFSIP